MSEPINSTLSTIQLLSTLQTMVDDVNQINSTNDKIERLKKYSQLAPFMKLLMDPLQTTGVTATQLQKYEEKISQKPPAKKKTKKSVEESKLPRETDLCELLIKLYQRDYSGNVAKDVILDFISQYPKYKYLIYKIIDKDLETRMDIKQINKAFDGLIKEFSVALANDFDKSKKYFEAHQNELWYISRKYDGIRCIVKLHQGKVTAYSRNGNHLPALAPLEKMLTPVAQELLKDVSLSSVVLDGEICALDEDGHENFTQAVSNAKRKSVQMEKFRFYVFDMLTLEEFEAGESSSLFTQRLEKLKKFIQYVNQPDYIRAVEQFTNTIEKFEELRTKGSQENWEGLMLRRDTTYKGKRSNDILKVKNFFTEEYEVKNYEVGPMRIIDEETKREVTIETLKSVIIEHKGNQVNVGSGFSLEERSEFYKDPSKIVGKVIAVRYFEESVDKEGKVSLRFPTFVGMYGKKRSV
jgi:DNA ligase-1